MHSYRITKYNPIYRNDQGAYLKDDWISISDIGKSFEAGVLSQEEYIKIETAYTNAILAFMKCNNLNSMIISDLSKNFEPKKSSLYPQKIIDLFDSIKNNQDIEAKDVPLIAKLILRENAWGKLASEKMFVHFGYDYYMYIGSKKPCKNTILHIENSGLFVEEFESPYFRQPNNFIDKLDLLDGVIEYCEFTIDEKIPLLEQIDSLEEDILQVGYDKRFVLKVEWQPDFNLNGHFRVKVILDDDWESPILEAKCSTMPDLKLVIEMAAKLIHTKLKMKNLHS